MKKNVVSLTPSTLALAPVDSRLVKVTPALARQWLDNCLWDRQRKYRPYHAQGLAETMRRGEFTRGTQIHFARLDNENHIVNGQHTLNAIVLCGESQELSILTTSVDSEQEIAALYARHDQHLKRTLADVYSAHGFDEKFKLTNPQVNAIGAGIGAIIGKFSNNRDSKSYEARSTDERARRFEEFGNEGRAYFEVIKGCPGIVARELRVGAVVGIALLTFKQAPALAREFWSQVAMSDGLKTGDPRKTLTNWLLSNPEKKNAAQRARIVATAWNAFVAGSSLSRFKVPDWTKPVVLNKK